MSRVGARQAKNALFDGFATVAKALSSGRRAEIIELLAQGERSVEQIADAIDQSIANTSHHLRTLAQAGLVASRRDGTYVRYRLASERVYDLWAALRDVAMHQVDGLDELADAYLGTRHDLEAITLQELQYRLDRDEVILIDVRPELEYSAGHIPGAISAPLAQLDQLVEQLPQDRQLVAYCRGPYCIYADEAVRRLSAKGRRAVRLQDGYPDWTRAHRDRARR